MADVINSAVTVNGNGGVDTLHVGTGNVEAIDADVNFDGGGNVNYIYYHDKLQMNRVAWDIGTTSVFRDGFFNSHTLTYSKTIQIQIDGNDGPTTFKINSAIGTEVDAYGNDGDDTFTVGGGNFGLSNVTYRVYGGEDNDKLIVDDSLSTGALVCRFHGSLPRNGWAFKPSLIRVSRG